MQTNEEIKQKFDHLCKEVILGVAKEENMKIITEAMCDTNQQNYMRDEFIRMGKLLK